MISDGFWTSQVSRHCIRMSGSSWKDGTTTEVVVEKSLTVGRALLDKITRYSHRAQTTRPAKATGM